MNYTNLHPAVSFIDSKNDKNSCEHIVAFVLEIIN